MNADKSGRGPDSKTPPLSREELAALRQREQRLVKELLDAVAAAPDPAALPGAAQRLRTERQRLSDEAAAAGHQSQRLTEARQHVEPLEHDAAAKQKALAKAEATWASLHRPLGVAAFEARLAAHERVVALRQSSGQLTPAANASMLDKGKAKAQQLATAGKIKMEELRFAGLEKTIGQQLIDGSREESVRSPATVAILEQVAAKRADIAALRGQCEQAAEALAAKKTELSQRLSLTAVGDSKTLAGEIKQADSQASQAEQQIAKLEHELPGLLLAEAPGDGPLAKLLAELRTVRQKLPASATAQLAASIPSVMDKVKGMSKTQKLVWGGGLAAVALLVLCCGGLGILGVGGGSGTGDAVSDSSPTGGDEGSSRGDAGGAAPSGEMPAPFAGSDGGAGPVRVAAAGPKIPAVGTSSDIRQRWDAYLDARQKMAELSRENPRVRIVGKIRDRADDILQIWGQALPVDGGINAPGIQLEQANLIVINADSSAIAYNYYRGGVHYYLDRTSGKNAFGMNVPVHCYGGPPAKLKEQASRGALARRQSRGHRGRDGIAMVWDLAARQETRRFEQHQAGLRSVALTPHGVVLVWVLEVPRQSEFFHYKSRDWQNQRGMQAVACTPDNRRLGRHDPPVGHRQREASDRVPSRARQLDVGRAGATLGRRAPGRHRRRRRPRPRLGPPRRAVNGCMQHRLAVPPCSLDYLAWGHAVHFRCRQTSESRGCAQLHCQSSPNPQTQDFFVAPATCLAAENRYAVFCGADCQLSTSARRW